MRKVLVIVCVIFFNLLSIAQQPNLNTTMVEDLSSNNESLEEIYEEYQKLQHYGAFVDFIPEVEDSVLKARISSIESDIPLRFDTHIKSFIDYFTVRNRDYTRKMIKRSYVYFPIIEEILAKNNMPQSLKYLAIVESGLDPKIKSWAGAIGLWQFMPATGKSYTLDYDYYVDEKQNPYKSTEAACKFLKDLYGMFGDWELALGAYNCGPGNMRKAIKASGGKRTFSEIYNFLPKETRSYVPQFMAVNYVMRYTNAHNLYVETWESEYLPSSDTIILNQYVDLNKLCELSGICNDQMLRLNPELKKAAVPETYKNYSLVIPKELLILGKDSIRSLMTLASIKSADAPTVEETKTTSSSTSTHTVTKKVTNKSSHYVKKGESLGTIASKYGTSITNIKKWNGIKGSTIYPGQRITIYKTSYVKVKVESTESPTQKETSQEKQTSESNKEISPEKTTTKPDVITKNKYYTVKKGDYLGKIAAANHVTISQIKSWNGMKSNTVALGQRLIVGKTKTTVKTETADEKTDTEDTKPEKETTVKPETKPVAKVESKPKTYLNGDKKMYIVRSGDVLGDIANENNVTLDKLKKWNNLSTNTIKVGQKLIVGYPNGEPEVKPKITTVEENNTSSPAKNTSTQEHIVKSGESLYSISKKYGLSIDELKKLNNLTANEVKVGQKLLVKKEQVAAKTDTQTSSKIGTYAGKTYTVKSGDSLWSITQKFEGLTVDELKKLNGLKTNEVKVGQVLKLG
jgi:membrane-bound lytic murein transglycosylase D